MEVQCCCHADTFPLRRLHIPQFRKTRRVSFLRNWGEGVCDYLLGRTSTLQHHLALDGFPKKDLHNFAISQTLRLVSWRTWEICNFLIGSATTWQHNGTFVRFPTPFSTPWPTSALYSDAHIQN